MIYHDFVGYDTYRFTIMIRSFFISVGVAMGVHPFGLQAGLRKLAIQRIQYERSIGNAYSEPLTILPALAAYGANIDARCLQYIWPDEFDNSRICFISKGVQGALLFTIYTREVLR